ncbi:hypothetical protein C0J52_25171 [Blattella germanica]|nr:hypothetical protein C0J52_25171 [Blattella germanica]
MESPSLAYIQLTTGIKEEAVTSQSRRDSSTRPGTTICAPKISSTQVPTEILRKIHNTIKAQEADSSSI